MKLSNSKLTDKTFLAKMRQTGDPVADAVVKEIIQRSDFQQIRSSLNDFQLNNQPFPKEFPAVLKSYFLENQTLPTWANPSKIQNGAEFFGQYAQALMSMLGFLSLPYCYAGADGARVLYKSQRIQSDTRKRLLETGQFIWSVMAKDAFSPQGKGIVSILKVRLMHASIRHYISLDNTWDSTWGLPINQEDMAGTNLAFSWICVRGLRKMDYPIDNQAIDDFLHLWNVIGFMMGVQSDLLPQNGKDAFWLDKSIAERQFRPSEAGSFLTNALLDYLKKETASKLPAGFAQTYMRFLLGDKIADLLQLPASNWTKNLLSAYQIRNNLSNLFPPDNQAFKQQVQKELAKEKVGFVLPISLS